MGCDIHIIVEHKHNSSKEWQPIQLFEKNEYYVTGSTEEGKDKEYEFRGVNVHRNYYLFSALCGVRQYNEGSPQLSEDPKGIPEDAHPFTKEYLNSLGRDGHSHSWNTFKELMDFVKTYPVIGGGLNQVTHLINDVMAYCNTVCEYPHHSPDKFRICYFFDC